MLNNLVLGRYQDKDTFIHRINPKTKVLALILFVLVVIINNKLLVATILLGYSLCLLYILRIDIKGYLKSLKSLSFFFIFLIIINLIFKVSLYKTLIMLFEIVLLINYSSIFTISTKPMDIAKGIDGLLMPLNNFNIQTKKISFSISLALRFIPLIYEQAIKIMRSQASRGLDYYDYGIKKKVDSLKSMIVPMFILSMRRADKLSDALEIRNFNFNNRTYYNQLKKGKCDYLIILGHFIMLILVIRIEVLL